jgi:hypothetical protein
MDDEWIEQMWDEDLKGLWSSWVVSVKPVETISFWELDDPDRYIGPAVQMDAPCYDRPDGTTDLERGAP